MAAKHDGAVAEVGAQFATMSTKDISLANDAYAIRDKILNKKESLAGLSTKVKNGNIEKEKLEKEVNLLRDQVKLKETRLKDISSQLAEESNETYQSEEKLYYKLTGALFDNDSPSGIVSGFNSKFGSKMFNFNTETESPFFIANNLWSLCEDGESKDCK